MGWHRMTEADWIDCSSLETMLAYLGERASSRKKMLFSCACVRRLWPLLDERLRLAVRVAERCADGRLSLDHLQQAKRLVRRRREQSEEEERRRASWMARAERAAAEAVEALLPREGPALEQPRDIRDPPDVISASRVARTAARAAEAHREARFNTPPQPREPIRRLEALDAVELVQEIFGNPFRPVTIEAAWQIWKEHTVERIARTIYQKRAFRNMPILADALEEAGCNDAGILEHCRMPVDHARGCWVVDALLGMV
jgi:hypothetical protein